MQKYMMQKKIAKFFYHKYTEIRLIMFTNVSVFFEILKLQVKTKKRTKICERNSKK